MDDNESGINMTAEIAIMNKHAIALAADSAVTINTSSGRKIFNTVNKLFALTKYAPVGIMVFGRADLIGVPWESIIKTYRSEIGNRTFDKLEEYVSNFAAFIRRSDHIFTPEIQQQYFRSVVTSNFNQIRNQVQRKIQLELSARGPLTDGDVRKILNSCIDDHLKHIASRGLIKGVRVAKVAQLKRKHKRAIEAIRKSVFEQLPVSQDLLEKLSTVAAEAFCRKVFNNSDSGVVIAGFGDRQIFPELQHMSFGGVGEGILRYETVRALKISHDNSALIKPFAQYEMVQTFMEGVDPSCQSVIDSYWRTIFEQFPDEVISALTLLTEPQKAALKNKLKNAGQRILGEFQNKLRDYQREQHIQPVVDAIDVLPKDLLAEVAESLVNLTSFKRRISMTSAETVGGPIDVAVISRGDGFVWIKRKHYFRPELNPQFLGAYYGGIYATQKQKS